MKVEDAAPTHGPAAKADVDRDVVSLRESLVELQHRLRKARVPTVILISGVDGAGKGEIANLLCKWMDPRGIDTHAFAEPTEDERERPRMWRFWQALPRKGQMGIMLSSWYHQPLLDRVYGRTTLRVFEHELERVARFERLLADEGAVVVKFWLHLGREAQRARFEALEADPDQAWRVTETDWKHLEMYPRFVRASRQIVSRTHAPSTPWLVVDGASTRDAALEVATGLLDVANARLDKRAIVSADRTPRARRNRAGSEPKVSLKALDMTRRVEKETYRERLDKYRAHLHSLNRTARAEGVSSVIVFEGWDAAGKGGAIRRLTSALDVRDYRVVSIGPPTAEERRYPYLWRFWRHVPRSSRVTIFDRSWYGRVLVERVEELASEQEVERAYDEINDFEAELSEHRTLVIKCWLHITPEEQLARFRARSAAPHKRWKLTDEDMRNRERWRDYEAAAHEMFARTNTAVAPWRLIEGNDKRHARLAVLDTVCRRLGEAIGQPGVPPGLDGDDA